MKICWDNLEKLRYVKKSSLWCRKDNRCKRYKFIEHCQTCQEPFLASIDSKHNKGLFCTNKCQRNTEEAKEKMRLAKLGRKLTEEHKRKIGIKSLGKKHTEEARKKMSLAQKGKKLTEEHKNKLRKLRIGMKHKKEDFIKFSGENSSGWKGGVTKKNIPLYNTYAHQISYAESTRRDPKNEDLLQVKCAYCDKWYNPRTTSIIQRIGALEGKRSGKQRLYCSEECKQLCPTFGNRKFSEQQRQIARKLFLGNKYRVNLEPSNKKYTVNYDYFKNIDSEDKAYWFGFILADGYVSLDNHYLFGLSIIDKEHLEKFKNTIEYTGSIKSYSKTTNNGVWSLLVRDKKFVMSLIEKGVIPRKTMFVTFPDFIDNDLLNHFIRGYWDGDGTVSFLTNTKHHKYYFSASVLGTKMFLEVLSKMLKDKCGLKSASLYYVKNSHIWSFSRSTLQALKVCNYLYKDASIFLERKRDKYIEYASITSKTKGGNLYVCSL